MKVIQSGRKAGSLLPSLVTTAGLFAAFYAIAQAMLGEIDKAVIAVAIAGVLDGIDGRIARMTGSESDFGAEYDSLVDTVAFGVAPAVILYSLLQSILPRFGMAICFFYLACTCLRLARFNVQSAGSNFVGLPSPPAAGFATTSVWFFWEQWGGALPVAAALYLCVIYLANALLMVSPYSYLSGKRTITSRRLRYAAHVALMLVVAVVFINPPVILMTIGYIYAAYPLYSRFLPQLDSAENSKSEDQKGGDGNGSKQRGTG